MLLVYTHKITPRITYIFKHICTRVLGLPVSFTTKVEELVAHDGPKLSYTTKKLGNELYLRSTDLLFEHGILSTDVVVQQWDGLPALFPVKDVTAAIPFDIFAGAFYLMSRYEEYLPHVKDDQGRFPASESIAVLYKFIKLPVIDIWVDRFISILHANFPNINIDKPVYEKEMLVTVSQAFKYTKIGFLRTLGGYMTDTWRLRFRENFIRTQVLLGVRKDPYNISNWLINVQKQVSQPFKVFYQLGNYGMHSKNIKHSKKDFQSVMKMIADYCEVGLLVSPQAIAQNIDLAVERKRLESIIHRPLKHIHIADFKLVLPQVYRDALDQEIQNDYTMGYPDEIGFRAGTSQSFLFYDLDYEIQTPLMIHPVAMQSDNVINYHNHTIDYVSLRDMQKSIQRVGGTFRLNFSNASFEDIFSKKLFRRIALDD
ncbi:polysaccharide deacetylase family protein [Dokdonia sp. Hel_I_53]|uniref:polysaccharide deacetylase family protein n=1 Tax=Dokdonia sp. Hel_I_53 TaxID=1566287 RepID=UPI001199862B|nr:polysaccharide deacetylase family protein [Dokdonia sp. Hel_I_53]TVZ52066.1 hypothetical protein OD90_1229 [Dokdonia sp. Hel_I_53]